MSVASNAVFLLFHKNNILGNVNKKIKLSNILFL